MLGNAVNIAEKWKNSATKEVCYHIPQLLLQTQRLKKILHSLLRSKNIDFSFSCDQIVIFLILENHLKLYYRFRLHTYH